MGAPLAPTPPVVLFVLSETSRATVVAVMSMLLDAWTMSLPSVRPLFCTRTSPVVVVRFSMVMSPLVDSVSPSPVLIVIVMSPLPELSVVPSAMRITAVPASRSAS